MFTRYLRNMEFEREIIVFDIETTGLSQKDHRVVQFACVILNTDLEIIDEWSTYINPGSVEWSPGAVDTHGITPEMVKGEKSFKELSLEILSKFKDRDICTHNGNRFDIPFIANEFDRVGVDFSVDDVNVFDTFAIEAKIASRKLDDLFNKYTGMRMEEAQLKAHDALSDVKATAAILLGQHKVFDLSSITNKASLDSDIHYTSEGIPFMSYGKYKGVPIEEVIKKDPEYIAWLVKSKGSKRFFNSIKKIYEKMK